MHACERRPTRCSLAGWIERPHVTNNGDHPTPRRGQHRCNGGRAHVGRNRRQPVAPAIWPLEVPPFPPPIPISTTGSEPVSSDAVLFINSPTRDEEGKEGSFVSVGFLPWSDRVMERDFLGIYGRETSEEPGITSFFKLFCWVHWAVPCCSSSLPFSVEECPSFFSFSRLKMRSWMIENDRRLGFVFFVCAFDVLWSCVNVDKWIGHVVR